MDTYCELYLKYIPIHALLYNFGTHKQFYFIFRNILNVLFFIHDWWYLWLYFFIHTTQKMVIAVSAIYLMYSVPFVTDNISD